MTTTSPSSSFVFFPQPISIAALPPSSADDTVSGNHTNGSSSDVDIYLYGWSASNSIVIAGGMEAASFDQACGYLTRATSKRMNQSLGQTEEERAFKVLGKCCQCSQDRGRLNESDPKASAVHQVPKLKGKGRALDQDGVLPLHLSPANLPSLCSMVVLYPITIVHYAPPSPSRLQFLSLVPLQLDLTSFTSPVFIDKAGRRRDAAVGGDKKEAQQSERSLLDGRIRTSATLDFTSPMNSCRGVVANLEEVVDWVSSFAPNRLCCHFTDSLDDYD